MPSPISTISQSQTASQPVPDADPSLTPAIVTDEDRFLFDLQGYILLRGALAPKDVTEMRDALNTLESQQQDDSHWRNPNHNPETDGPKSQPTREEATGQLRLNGLLRLSNAFDRLIDYPTIFPYIQAFMNNAQLANTWSISKFDSAAVGSWHRGNQPHKYAVPHANINCSMINTVYFLTDNNIDDGCMLAIPGGHKSNFNLNWGKYKGLDLPGSIPITGKAGDVLVFTESLLHTGLGNTAGRRRSNLYFNYVSLDFNIATFSPQHNYHYIMPPHVRNRFTPARKQASSWMEHMKTID